jgi:multiple sugar transport system ATP-binding protein
MVFQSYALYPHMSVYDNMAFGLTKALKVKEFVRDESGNQLLDKTAKPVMVKEAVLEQRGNR